MVTAWRRKTVALVMTVSGGCDPDSITGFDAPPDLVIRTADETIELEPHSFSNQDMVADGPTIPADGPTVVIHSRELVIEYPLRDWIFHVDRPSMSSGITLQSLGDGRYRISPPGAAGDHVVWITGQDVDDPRSGASLVFRWVISDE